MIRRFKDEVQAAHRNEKSALRALQCWQILISMASNSSTITFLELARMMNYKTAVPLKKILERLRMFCDLNGLPPLYLIAVEQHTGTIGKMYESPMTLEDQVTERMRVFKYPWFEIVPPGVEDFMLLDSQKHSQLRETGD